MGRFGLPFHLEGRTEREPTTVIQLLIQLPDAGTLHELLDAQALRQVAARTGCFLFVIEDGRVTPVAPTPTGDA